MPGSVRQPRHASRDAHATSPARLPRITSDTPDRRDFPEKTKPGANTCSPPAFKAWMVQPRRSHSMDVASTSYAERSTAGAMMAGNIEHVVTCWVLWQKFHSRPDRLRGDQPLDAVPAGVTAQGRHRLRGQEVQPEATSIRLSSLAWTRSASTPKCGG